MLAEFEALSEQAGLISCTATKTVIQALRHLGPEQINTEVIEHLRQTLTTREKAALRREALNTPV